MADIRKLAHELLLSYEKEERYANLLLSSPNNTVYLVEFLVTPPAPNSSNFV